MHDLEDAGVQHHSDGNANGDGEQNEAADDQGNKAALLHD